MAPPSGFVASTPEAVREAIIRLRESPLLKAQDRALLDRFASDPAMTEVWDKLRLPHSRLALPKSVESGNIGLTQGGHPVDVGLGTVKLMMRHRDREDLLCADIVVAPFGRGDLRPFAPL